MNWLMVVNGLTMVGASGWAAWTHNPKTAALYLCYAAANFILATIKG